MNADVLLSYLRIPALPLQTPAHSHARSQAKDSASIPTSIYCRLPTTYQLKMKSSRETYSEIVKKAGAFPFPLRILENEGRAKLA